jgi:8-amino-7-oxononanoate synthase
MSAPPDLSRLSTTYRNRQSAKLAQRLELVASELSAFVESGYYFYRQTIERIRGSRVWVDGKEKILFATYDYLGLLEHPGIREAAVRATEKFGTGSGGTRLVAGTFDVHVELERRIAEMKGTDAAIVFGNGFMTNVAFFSTLFTEADCLVVDKLCHASIIDGCRLSGAMLRSFQHNSARDLEAVLSSLRRDRGDGGEIVVAVDAIYSMDGDLAALPEIAMVAKQYGARVFVDEAHSLGILGRTGRGIDEHFDVHSVDYFMGSLSKAIPAMGGYIAADKETIDYLRHYARPFVFSASLPPATAAAALAAIDVLTTETWRRERLWRNQQRFSEALRAMDFNLLDSNSPIVPVVFRDPALTLRFSRFLNEHGVFICPILYPAVPVHASRLRAHVTASHSDDDLDMCLGLFRDGQNLLLP